MAPKSEIDDENFYDPFLRTKKKQNLLEDV